MMYVLFSMILLGLVYALGGEANRPEDNKDEA